MRTREEAERRANEIGRTRPGVYAGLTPACGVWCVLEWREGYIAPKVVAS